MRFLECTWPTPAENLACDEALLEACESEPGEGFLRTYEPREDCVVLGYGNHADREADLAACASGCVPVLRRASGGGAVLLGPGCLAYALVLPLESEDRLATVGGTNRWVMERHREALQALVPGQVEVRGCTDLALEGLKFSGNSQRRRRRALLFHGTFLLHLDLDRVDRFLRHPSREPDYRGGRSHRDFIRNLDLPAEVVRDALRRAWGAFDVAAPPPEAAVRGLVLERYGRPEWNLKF